MIEVQEHWKKVGRIVDYLLAILESKLDYGIFKNLDYSDKEWCSYFYMGKPWMNLKFHKMEQVSSSGNCRLLSEEGKEKIEVNCYFSNCCKEDYEYALRVTLLHEVTHALQYSLKFFMGESSREFGKPFKQESDWFQYMIRLAEIDAELSTYYNLNKEEFHLINKNKLESYYQQYTNVPKRVLKAVSRFVWNYLTTGVYNNYLRETCTGGF